jgi:acetyl esterase/lipase
VRGFSTDVGSTSAALESLVDEVGAQRVVFTGNSAGGYAALLFGALSRSPVLVHAFSPQTFLGRWRRLVVHDRRWKEEIGRLRASDAGSEWMDLRGVLKASSGRSVLHVHYPAAHRLDRLHAWRLRGLPGVELHPEEGGGHNVIRTLRDRGELGPLIAGALAPDPPDRPA